MYCIILAGGSGIRLWPLSRESNPKQLLKINSNRTLLQLTIDRMQEIVPTDKMLVVVNHKNAAEVRKQLLMNEKTSAIRVLPEPVAKNTAPAIAISTKYILDRDCDDIVIVVPADHKIKDVGKFKEAIQNAKQLAKLGYIVTLGVKPNSPNTNYGYIKVGNKISVGYSVSEFKEKPSIEKAKKYIQSLQYYWNAGIFIFKASVIMDALEEFAPDIYDLCKLLDFSQLSTIDTTVFTKFPFISIDYAVLEKSKNVAMVELESDWNDLGSWDAVYEDGQKEEQDNVLIGTAVQQECENTMLYAATRLVVGMGLKDIYVIETTDSVLVCHKDMVPHLKSLVNDKIANIYKY